MNFFIGNLPLSPINNIIDSPQSNHPNSKKIQNIKIAATASFLRRTNNNSNHKINNGRNFLEIIIFFY